MVQKTHKGFDSQREQGQGRSQGFRSEALTLELLCERHVGEDVHSRAQAGGDVLPWEPSGGSHQPVPALVRVRLGNLMGDLQWIAGGGGAGREP